MSIITTNIPARLDRLPWSRFHWFVVIVLGVTWILDGLEVALKSAVSSMLQHPLSLGLTTENIGLIISFYMLGTVIGALVFGFLTDRYGRKKMFYVTLGIYLVGAIASAFSWNLTSFCFFRFLTGLGIGGEYTAINSAVDELIPARVRGRVGLMVNASYWLGAALASLSTFIILDPNYFSPDVGWRVGFGIGALMSVMVLFLRRFVPESPRWLVVHGRSQEAEQIVSTIERQIEQQQGIQLSKEIPLLRMNISPCLPLKDLVTILWTRYRRHSVVSLALIIAQAFLYNSIFFTYALVLTTFYNIDPSETGLFLFPFALGNLIGPFVLGPFFDSVGRRIMIGGTYAISALLLLITGYLFMQGYLTAQTQTLLWTIIFFFGSAAASSAYLTVSEIFPLETRGLAIAIFFALGTGVGGVLAPYIFSVLISTAQRELICYGYFAVAILMFVAATIEFVYGIDAEKKSLEEIASPLASQGMNV